MHKYILISTVYTCNNIAKITHRFLGVQVPICKCHNSRVLKWNYFTYYIRGTYFYAINSALLTYNINFFCSFIGKIYVHIYLHTETLRTFVHGAV